MVWVPWSELRKREAAVLDACAELILTRPLAEITIKAVAESSGLPLWAAHGAIQRVARDRPHLIRRGVLRISTRLADAIRAARGSDDSVMAAIEALIGDTAALLRTDAFAGLYRVVLCEGPFQRWLHDIYEEKVAGAFCRELEARVEVASRGNGVAVVFPAGATREILRRLETALLLPSLLPGQDPSPADEAALVRTIAREAFSRTYAWDLGEAA
jgi:hypothetical protein